MPSGGHPFFLLWLAASFILYQKIAGKAEYHHKPMTTVI